MNASAAPEMVMHEARRAFKYWTTREIAILKDHYPSGGVEACAALLTGRSWSAIYNRAVIVERLRNPKDEFSGRRWKATPAIDAAIRATYEKTPRKNAVSDLAASLMRPRWWCSRRAAALGLVAPRWKDPDWSEAEVALLERHSTKDLGTLYRLFDAAGYRRTHTAISLKRKRLNLEIRDPERYSATQLAGLLGVSGKAVTRWIEAEGLPAERRGTKRTPQQGGDMWWIDRRRLRGWIGAHAQLVDLRKVDRFWFIDLMLNRSAA